MTRSQKSTQAQMLAMSAITVRNDRWSAFQDPLQMTLQVRGSQVPMTLKETPAVEQGHQIRKVPQVLIASKCVETSLKITHQIIDLADLTGTPPTREWTWQELIPRGQVSSLYGDGGTGKTLLAHQLATHIARRPTGNSSHIGEFLGKPILAGRVLALFAEDDKDELWRRQEAINLACGITMDELEDLKIISGFGEENLLMTQKGSLTSLYSHLLSEAKKHQPELIIIDNAADTFAGVENDRAAVTRFLKVCLGGLAKETGASVLLLAHPSVAGLYSGEGSGGSTAWNNSVRSRLYLEQMDPADDEYDPDVRTISLKKANYTQRGSTLRIRWRHGVFELEKVANQEYALLDKDELETLILTQVRWLNQNGENISPNSRAGNFGPKRLMKCEPISKLKLRKDKIEKILDSLLRKKLMAIGEYRNNGRSHQRYMAKELEDTNT